MGDLKTGLVIRGRKYEEDGTTVRKPFSKEDLNGTNQLQEASVNSKEGSKVSDFDTVKKGMRQSTFKAGYSTSTVQKIIQKGGRVMVVKLPGNKYHCQIFGLSLSDANNLFSNRKDW